MNASIDAPARLEPLRVIEAPFRSQGSRQQERVAHRNAQIAVDPQQVVSRFLATVKRDFTAAFIEWSRAYDVCGSPQLGGSTAINTATMESARVAMMETGNVLLERTVTDPVLAELPNMRQKTGGLMIAIMRSIRGEKVMQYRFMLGTSGLNIFRYPPSSYPGSPAVPSLADQSSQ